MPADAQGPEGGPERIARADMEQSRARATGELNDPLRAAARVAGTAERAKWKAPQPASNSTFLHWHYTPNTTRPPPAAVAKLAFCIPITHFSITRGFELVLHDQESYSGGNRCQVADESARRSQGSPEHETGRLIYGWY